MISLSYHVMSSHDDMVFWRCNCCCLMLIRPQIVIIAYQKIEAFLSVLSEDRNLNVLSVISEVKESSLLYCAVLYWSVLLCCLLKCTVLCCSALFCSVLSCFVLCCSLISCLILYCTVLYCSALF